MNDVMSDVTKDATKNITKKEFNLNFLQKMMIEVLTGDMAVALFVTEHGIRSRVKRCDNDTIRAFFENYTTEELLDVIEQTIKNQE